MSDDIRTIERTSTHKCDWHYYGEPDGTCSCDWICRACGCSWHGSGGHNMETCRNTLYRALNSRDERIREIEAKLAAAVAHECKQCAAKAPIYIEPDTQRYTHTLGGNYCGADYLHHIIGTVPAPPK